MLRRPGGGTLGSLITCPITRNMYAWKFIFSKKGPFKNEARSPKFS